MINARSFMAFLKEKQIGGKILTNQNIGNIQVVRSTPTV